MFDTNLAQLIYSPTHVKGNTLDILLTNSEHIISHISVSKPYDSLPSDHYKISFFIESNFPLNKSHKPVFVFDYKRANYEGLCDFLLDVDFSYYLQSVSVDQVWSFLKATISRGMNLFIPKVRITITNHPKWFNSEIRHVIKCLRTQRRKCTVRPTPNNFSNLQSLESRLSGLITSAKTHFEQTLCSQSSTEIFSYIKSLSSAPSVPPIVSLDDSTGSNDCDKVSLFNSFFHSVFTRSDFEIPPLEELPVAT